MLPEECPLCGQPDDIMAMEMIDHVNAHHSCFVPTGVLLVCICGYQGMRRSEMLNHIEGDLDYHITLAKTIGAKRLFNPGGQA